MVAEDKVQIQCYYADAICILKIYFILLSPCTNPEDPNPNWDYRIVTVNYIGKKGLIIIIIFTNTLLLL